MGSTLVHQTRLVEGPIGMWTAHCYTCLLEEPPQALYQHGLVLLEDHERYVRHRREPDQRVKI